MKIINYYLNHKINLKLIYHIVTKERNTGNIKLRTYIIWLKIIPFFVPILLKKEIPKHNRDSSCKFT